MQLLILHLPYIATTRSVNGGASTVVDQPDSGGGGVVISVPVQLNLNNGANSITFGSGQSSASLSLTYQSPLSGS